MWAVCLLSLSLGLHWAVLQTAAWAGMFLERVQTESVSAAIEKTFDGEHPCRVCLLVREGRRAQTTDDSAPGPVRTVKLDACVRLDAVPVLEPSAAPPAAYPDGPPCERRSEPPSLPPPRSA